MEGVGRKGMGLLRLLLLACVLTPSLRAQQPTPILPDPKLTPGDVFDVTAEDVCAPGYSRKVRNVPPSVKEQVYREYGISTHPRGSFEVDHLISLELGGSNSIRNLWPESYHTTWNARVKDRLENRLHQLVCAGKLDLKAAQQAIASNWIDAYKKYVGPEPKALGRPSEDERAEAARVPPAAVGQGQVWVNTRSGKYWRPGSPYYGRTKRGKFMTEEEAQKRGFQPAHGTGE
jgi:hypothetical protein